MISAGSKSRVSAARCDLPAGAWRRPHGDAVISRVLVLTAVPLFQGCGNSETKASPNNDAAMPRPASNKGDILVRDAYCGPAAGRRFPTVMPAIHSRIAILALHTALLRSVARGPSVARSSARQYPGSYKVASLSPELPYGLPAGEAGADPLIGFENSAFPYFGKNPRSGGGAYARAAATATTACSSMCRRDSTCSKPGVIVVFFHGHGATLERDVRDRQLLPKQITESGVNAVHGRPAAGLRCRRFQRRKVLGARRVQALHGGSGRGISPEALRRSPPCRSVREDAGDHRRLQRRLRAPRPRACRSAGLAAGSSAWCCSMHSTGRWTNSRPGS